MGGESAEFLKRVIDEFHCVKGIMLSDNDGVLICQSAPQKENEKFVQTTALLISALNQTQSNLQKVQLSIGRPKHTPTYALSTFTIRTISFI
jgi:predicted regulator of Ras-like GTPase activity (Roadblock/LC7/MglB family)